MFVEGIFRRPRLWSNTELRKFAHYFKGDIVNVSGAQDFDKEIKNPLKYFFTHDYDSGNKYKDYFKNATNYYISNYSKDNRRGHDKINHNNKSNINLDLNEPIPKNYKHTFDVVFNHTVLEHVFDIFTAFKNLCDLSKDIVILIVPFSQMVHDFHGSYKDYWRFTPFAVEELFKRNNFTVIYRNSNKQFSTSIYYFYIATRNPTKWKSYPEFKKKRELLKLNLGQKTLIFSYLQIHFESTLRKLSTFIKKLIKFK